jgi:hypothetical protein
MLTASRAGLVYFLIVFAIGFVLGTIRVLVVVPRFGDTNAVMLELPVMLAASWFACRWIVARFAVPPAVAPRLTMGGLAFALLMLAELAVSVAAFGRTPGQHVATYLTPASQLGLAAQLGFALLPLLQAKLRPAH